MTQALRLVPGRIFAGDYKVVRPLTAGGQGSLYVVEQVSTSKLRALKLMLPELVAQPISRRRFELEAKIAARIQSDHVVESIASGVDAASGTPWLVMELLEGEDLAAYTQKKKRLPPAEVLEIFSQLCHALGEAHRQGIVHRDLKPENVFLATPRRRGVPFMVKVLDFGIARILAEVQTISGSTTSGLGTPMWMAPEQTVPGGPVGPGTDVWPLGLLAFRLLTGYLFWKAPYDPGASVMMLMAEAFMHPMPTASERAEHYKCKDRLPPGFDAWFARCVARPIDGRFADASEAFGALEPLLVTFQGPGDKVTAPPPAPAPEAADAAADDAPARVSGPGRTTWEGAPELAHEAVISAAASGPVTPPPEPEGAPAVAAPEPEGAPAVAAAVASDADGAAAADDASEPAATPTAESPVLPAQPVLTPARPAGGNRTRSVVLAATVAGVLIGGALFAFQRGTGPGPVPGARPSITTGGDPPRAPATVTTAAPQPSASGAEPDPQAADPAGSASAATSASAEPTAGGRARGKLCRPAGAKCFSHDDCCDRTCRKWVCRSNAALQNPYDDK